MKRFKVKKWDNLSLATPEENKRAARRRASMKANARKAELARIRKADAEESSEFKARREDYFSSLKLALVQS